MPEDKSGGHYKGLDYATLLWLRDVSRYMVEVAKLIAPTPNVNNPNQDHTNYTPPPAPIGPRR
jgi:hypothetical protein